LQVYGSHRKTDKNSLNLNKLGIEAKIKLMTVDIQKYNDVVEAIDYSSADEIYCLAAQSSVGNSFKNPLDTIKSNTLGTLNILEACRALNYQGRIFFAGSSEIFGHQVSPIDLESKMNPKSPYAISKHASQNLVTLYRESYDLKAITGILFNHESQYRDQRFITQKIIMGAIRSHYDKNYTLKIGNINIERDWGWAEEYVEAMQLITRANQVRDYIVCTGKKTSLKDFIEKVYDKLNLDWQEHVVVDKNLFRPNDIKVSWGNPDQLFNDLGWKATIFIDEIIDKLIEAKLSQS
tara:strand:+ start:696 stop:1574 length:879 start_codon:yes stop_codon:yes gene_type:complete